MRKGLEIIDWMNEQTGLLSKWLVLLLILMVFSDTIARYIFNAPLSFGYESASMLGAAIYALFWGHVHKHHSHVRVDLLYGLLSKKGQAIVDIVFAGALMFPLLFITIRIAALATVRSYIGGEVLTESYWYPPVWPMRAVILISLVLLMLQCVAEFVRDINFVAKGVRP